MTKVQKILQRLEDGQIDNELAESLISDVVHKVRHIHNLKMVKEIVSIIGSSAFAAIGIWFFIKVVLGY